MRVLKGRGEEGPVVVNGVQGRRCLYGELTGKRECSGIEVWPREAEEEGHVERGKWDGKQGDGKVRHLDRIRENKGH